jgi:hypothetical protein
MTPSQASSIGAASGTSRPEEAAQAVRHQNDAHAGPQRAADGRVQPRAGDTDEQEEPQAGRDVGERRSQRDCERQPPSAMQEGGDGQDAERERQCARIEVRFERIHRGARNPVPHRDRGAEQQPVTIGW